MSDEKRLSKYEDGKGAAQQERVSARLRSHPFAISNLTTRERNPNAKVSSGNSSQKAWVRKHTDNCFPRER